MDQKTYRVSVRLKPSVLDPQGKTVAHALHALGFDEVQDVRIGKLIDLKLAADLPDDEVRSRIESMCQRLLANPVIEDFHLLEH